MKKKLLNPLLFALSAAFIFSACRKNDAVVPAPVILQPSKGAYVLSEGGFGANNTKLAYYTTATNTVTGDFFLQQNPTIPAGLGDTGNDAVIYGSKMYVVVNNSNRVTVLNAANAVFIQNITGFTAFQGPRYAAAARGKVYVTAYDGTVRVIDTTSLTIVKTINVGPNPEGIAASANYLYVANSGGFNPIPDSTVSLIDLSTETEIRKIKVGINPNKVEIAANGNVYVSAYGNFSTKPPSISVIDGTANLTSVSLGTSYPYSHVRIFGNTAYFYNNYPVGGAVAKIKVYNTASNALIRNEFITDGTPVTATYAINVDANGDVYIGDAGNFTTSGKVIVFTDAGLKKFAFSVAPGTNPNKIIFNR